MTQLLRLRVAAVAFAMTMPQFAVVQTAPAIQVPIPKTAADVPGPVPGNTMTSAYVQFVGRMAYMWVSDGERAQPSCGVRPRA